MSQSDKESIFAYSVEFKRKAYVSVQVQAKSADEAERLAWEQIENGDYNHLGFWELDSINIDDPYQP